VRCGGRGGGRWGFGARGLVSAGGVLGAGRSWRRPSLSPATDFCGGWPRVAPLSRRVRRRCRRSRRALDRDVGSVATCAQSRRALSAGPGRIRRERRQVASARRETAVARGGSDAASVVSDARSTATCAQSRHALSVRPGASVAKDGRSRRRAGKPRWHAAVRMLHPTFATCPRRYPAPSPAATLPLVPPAPTSRRRPSRQR
jgi:hypothetical protein